MDELDIKIDEGKQYVRNRITSLRMNVGISEYQLSLELGQNKGYIQSISSGKALPSMTGFFNICDYFHITPMDFFNDFMQRPELINNLIQAVSGLNDDDLDLLITIADRLQKKNK